MDNYNNNLNRKIELILFFSKVMMIFLFVYLMQTEKYNFQVFFIIFLCFFGLLIHILDQTFSLVKKFLYRDIFFLRFNFLIFD